MQVILRGRVLAIHTARLLHHNELLVRGMINLNRLQEEEGCECEKEGGHKVVYFCNSRVLFLCFFTLSYFQEKWRRGEGGGDNRCAPPFRELLV